jgi:hypothetical protein
MAGDRAMGSLQVAADEYIAIRRSTGFKFEEAANLLSDFVRHSQGACARPHDAAQDQDVPIPGLGRSARLPGGPLVMPTSPC